MWRWFVNLVASVMVVAIAGCKPARFKDAANSNDSAQSDIAPQPPAGPSPSAWPNWNN